MIITQTPLRVSFFGGGTDFRKFYSSEEGCVLSTALNKYIFVTIKERFDDQIRVGYTRTELASNVDELEHELVRESLRRTGLYRSVEIDTMGDIPSAGSGLGSSSAVTVGVLHAIYAHQGRLVDAETLARQASEIEVDVLHKPMGKQDQYIAAYGGLRFFRFLPDESVVVESLRLTDEQLRRFSRNLLLFYTRMTRKAESILAEQDANINERRATLRQLKEFACTGRTLLENGDEAEFGHLLHESWLHKKKLASKISNGTIDAIYDSARAAGAWGGKITGAGGGGFLLLWCPQERQDQVRQALEPLPELPVRLEPSGTKVIFNYARG